MKRITVLLLVLAALVVALGGCELLGSKEILYQVIGTALSVDIRYEDEEGDLAANYNVTPPWSHSFTVNRVSAAILVHVSAEVSIAGGDVTVTIREDGSQVDTDTASGAGALAEAWGIIE